MHKAITMLALGIALAVTCSEPQLARADDAVGASAAPVEPASVIAGAPIADPAVLDAQRGGTDTRLSEIHASGAVSEVSVSNALTGSNSIADGVLTGASGIPMFIQNTGNGVLIQNAVIVNVELQ